MTLSEVAPCPINGLCAAERCAIKTQLSTPRSIKIPLTMVRKIGGITEETDPPTKSTTNFTNPLKQKSYLVLSSYIQNYWTSITLQAYISQKKT